MTNRVDALLEFTAQGRVSLVFPRWRLFYPRSHPGLSALFLFSNAVMSCEFLCPFDMRRADLPIRLLPWVEFGFLGFFIQ